VRRLTMPKHIADELQAVSLQDLLTRRGLAHLRVRRHSTLLVVESGPEDDRVSHVRFRRHGAHIWTVEVATHRGGWEPTPLRGQIEHLLEAVVTGFPWVLEPIE